MNQALARCERCIHRENRRRKNHCLLLLFLLVLSLLAGSLLVLLPACCWCNWCGVAVECLKALAVTPTPSSTYSAAAADCSLHLCRRLFPAYLPLSLAYLSSPYLTLPGISTLLKKTEREFQLSGVKNWRNVPFGTMAV